MPDDLYERDILEWSARQADLLRRLATDENHNGVDWSHVIEEIEAVGTAQLNDFRGIIRQALIALIRTQLDPNNPARSDWTLEFSCLLDDAAEQFTPSMRDRIDLRLIWERVRARAIRRAPNDPRALALPEHCPWTVEALLAADHDALVARLAGWPVS